MDLKQVFLGVTFFTNFSFEYLASASGGRSLRPGNHPNSVVTEEGLTIILVKGNICDQMVSARFECRPLGLRAVTPTIWYRVCY